MSFASTLDQLCQSLITSIPKNALALQKVIRRFPRDHTHPQNPFYTKAEILAHYQKNWSQLGARQIDSQLLQLLQVKPIRTQSGVATITILTKPYPCPGQCIFCPADVRMPKSYLANEPGAQRAEMNYFDPYLQTISRLINLQDMGHPLDKIELIILGGTWTAYPKTYQIWFVKEAFRALNDFSQFTREKIKILCQKQEQIYLDYQQALQDAEPQHKFLSNNKIQNAQNFAPEQANLSTTNQNPDQNQHAYNRCISELYLAPEIKYGLAPRQTATWSDLEKQHQINQKSTHRNVGLVIETRPDEITAQALTDLRRLGATKIQIGVQSVNDEILKLNRRCMTTAQIKNAFQLLRIFGFKIHAHFMANLYGSNPEKDQADFQEFFQNPAYRPDELKLYPCSLIESAPLLSYYQNHTWRPYTEEELLKVLVANLLHTPAYCRLTRMIRDISSADIVVGNKKTNFRQLVDQEIKRSGGEVVEIRSREIKNQTFKESDLILDEIKYQTLVSTEYFLQFITRGEGKIAGFLRLSLPKNNAKKEIKLPAELKSDHVAMIREIHVYGAVAALGEKSSSAARTKSKAQHLGLGTKLIARAQEIAQQNHYSQLAVISAIGTREYYSKQGFEQKQLYQIKKL